MTKKTESTIFERARKLAESGSSGDCTAMIAELKRLQADEEAQAADVRPPGEQVTGGDGRVHGVLPAGRRFLQAAEADAHASGEFDTSDCTVEYQRLMARLATTSQLLRALQKRKYAAEAEEKLAAAPAEAKRAIAVLDALADRHQAAREELAAIHAELQGTFQAIFEARELDPSVATVSLAQFYRAGVELAYTLPVRREAIEGGFHEPERRTTPLFGTSVLATKYARALIDVPQTLWEKTRKILGRRDPGLPADCSLDTSDKAVGERLYVWYEELVRLLGAGDVDAARGLGAPSYPHKSRGRPFFEDDAAA